MRKICVFLLAFLLLGVASTVTSCSSDPNKKKVKEYAKLMVDKISTNQYDAISGSFPDIELATGIVPLDNTKISVSPTDVANEYLVTLKDGVTLKVKVSEDGNISVLESKGLFQFSPADLQFAKKTGMYEDNISDSELARRLKDEGFKSWIQQQASQSALKLDVGPLTYNSKMDYDDYGDYTRHYQGVRKVTVTNNSSTPVKASDYNVAYVAKHWTCCEYEKYVSSNRKAKGVALNPGESATITLATDYSFYNLKPKIESPRLDLAISEAELASSYQYKGDEYKQYMGTTGATEAKADSGSPSASSGEGIVKLAVRDISNGPEGKLNNQAGNTYGASNMFDGKSSTGWAVKLADTDYASQPYLYGPEFTVNGSKIDHIVLRNGYHKSSDSYKKNTRASWARIARVSGGSNPSQADILWEGTISDSMTPQTLKVNPNYDQSRPAGRVAIFFSSKADDRYFHGSKWDDLVVSELEFWGKP